MVNRYFLSLCSAALLGAVPAPLAAAPANKAPEPVLLGWMSVGQTSVRALFSPAEDGKSYRVELLCSRPRGAPPMKARSVDVWLLARGGKALPVKPVPRMLGGGDPWRRGNMVCATFLFERTVEQADLIAVVVALDGKPTMFKLPPAAPRGRAEAPAPVNAVAKAEERKALKVFARAAFHDDVMHIGPISFDRTDQHLLLRSAEDLAASTRKAKATKGLDFQKGAAFQKATQDQLVKLLGVKSINWDRQMVIAVSGGRIRHKSEVEFLSFVVRANTLTVKWRRKDLAPGFVTTPRGIALVERFEGPVRFDPPPLE
jgi:hypothetical protein